MEKRLPGISRLTVTIDYLQKKSYVIGHLPVRAIKVILTGKWKLRDDIV